jgi:alpha-tubulin suppressor-like RCC1 family protein
MRKSSRIIVLSSYAALACSGMLMSTGCEAGGEDRVDSGQVALEIRFQDDNAAMQPPSAGLLTFVAAAPGPTTYDAVARILVDITFADSGQPFFTNFELTELATDVWRGDVPLLPRNQQLRFAARGLSASGEVGFSGETVATLTVDNQSLEIPLAPAQNNQTFQMPRMLRIVYPAEMFAGQEEQVAFTLLSNAGAAIGLQITALASPTTSSADFSPATGTVTLTSTVADFMTVYTPPEVTVDTDFDYQVTITDARAQSAVAITTNFRTHVRPRPPGGAIVRGTRPSVLFNPVILSLTANGSETPGTVELVAAVSDDSAPAQLAFQWSYAPNTGTPSATFDNNGQSVSGLFQGYTVAHQGTITLAVTDEHNGTTTLHYPLTPNQFADAIDHASVNGLKRIVSGDAHTCVLTDQNQVRCWGDNQFGQLGYGNAIDVGDTPSRLPYTVGDVALPVDPMTHLSLDPVQQLVAGNNHTCVLLQSGLAYCWGDNRFGQLGYNRADNLGDGEPVTSFGFVSLGDLAIRIAAGGDHTCAILQSGAVRCWGRNDFGQLGRGNTANLGDNETVFSAGNADLGASVTVKDLALGGYHTCALLTTGAVRCWGRNHVGQLGYGHTANLGDNEPINNLPNVSLTGTVRKLVAGDSHTCALTFAGTLRCWGYGLDGELGQSFGGSDAFWGNALNELPSTLPSDIHTGAQVTDVTTGRYHTCALSSDGQLRCWGLGSSGQLGYGNFNNLGAPPAAGVNLDGITAYRIIAGAAHTCALRSNGTARCWGAGADGRLGRGSTFNRATATGNVDIQIFPPPQGQLPPPTFYSNVGAIQTLVVPSGVRSIAVKAWGAGGGGAVDGVGGGGGFSSSALIPVTSGETLTIVVGQGGRAGATAPAFGGGGFRNPGGPVGCNGTFLDPPWSGGGGGYSGVFRGTVAQTRALLIAGGGGGGGAGGGIGGVGGGATGGVSNLTGGRAGSGTQTSGGGGGVGATVGLPGSALQGGNGDCAGQGGSGGGGYFGGGGSGAVNGADAGGGGGSGFAPGGTTVAGSGFTPAMTIDPDYANGLAVGGAAFTDGGDGLVVITFL